MSKLCYQIFNGLSETQKAIWTVVDGYKLENFVIRIDQNF